MPCVVINTSLLKGNWKPAARLTPVFTDGKTGSLAGHISAINDSRGSHSHRVEPGFRALAAVSDLVVQPMALEREIDRFVMTKCSSGGYD